MMKKVNRRTFFSTSFKVAAAASLPVSFSGAPNSKPDWVSDSNRDHPSIIDTNVNLFDWPFRKLKYGDTEALMTKLRQHRVEKAWAGSFEALFHKDIDGVNSRLAKECSTKGKGMLVPFGTVNLAWPDWEEDLRRCQEVYKMPGVRIFPIYQTFDPDHPDFGRLVEQVAKRNMILQIVGDMEDSRNHHPIVLTRELNMHSIVDILKKFPDIKVQMLYWNHRVGADVLKRLVEETNTVFDIARVETSGGVGRLIEGNPWSGSPDIPVPVGRILFGSHAPFFPIESSLIKLLEAPLNEHQAKAIMNENATRFLG